MIMIWTDLNIAELLKKIPFYQQEMPKKFITQPVETFYQQKIFQPNYQRSKEQALERKLAKKITSRHLPEINNHTQTPIKN